MFTEFLKNHFFIQEKKYEVFLDDPSSEIGRVLSFCLTALVFIFMFILSFESVGDNALTYAKEIFIFDAFIASIFALEYIYRYIKAQKKLYFFFKPIRLIDLLSFLPFFLGFIAAGNFLVLFRLLRVLRVLRLVDKIPLTAGFMKSLKDYLDEYRAVFLLFFVTLFLGSFFVYYFESQVAGSKFSSIPQSLWWGLVTMTTVGYGDMVPVTPLGKTFAAILVFLGPLLLALSSAVTIMVFTEAARNHSIQKTHLFKSKLCEKCKAKNRTEANYCSTCGEKF